MIFVTVGTTSFDALISKINTEEFLTCMKQKGYKALKIQIGRGHILPTDIMSNTHGIHVEYYRYNAGYKQDIHNATLVISHAGSGSIMDALSARKPLLVVVNGQLMDNHQTELADALQEKNYLIATIIPDFIQCFRSACFSELTEYPEPNLHAFPQLLASELGWK